ncbi:hypothetical protein HanXRQr2_Chr17g0808081 [Helianthus annuus]|uniref:Uncharacterized protein n=1 Tax=Helianthus annuus TaxID=4232 RepID=A0A9K3DIW7_HELAN|nr:hypothetical protein HanXRQr2_Chr17g0808081 [Helianthus annuus]KAJ0429516.1 hypothetical protein HanHA300_Chr17g0658281 [Helianthus annuus]KAJ0434047.1 hypothetical protein HanIR_Chr17g0877041 [Helianthus annuus]KAJ0636641.1 hypothetical protein HanOQP8_Chr17g0664321 [Helianthus annuus]KAJ0807032.1 hypothetical protein HanLR1_Chr00c1405g0805511 [Helianthus annuus]
MTHKPPLSLDVPTGEHRGVRLDSGDVFLRSHTTRTISTAADNITDKHPLSGDFFCLRHAHPEYSALSLSRKSDQQEPQINSAVIYGGDGDVDPPLTRFHL